MKPNHDEIIRITAELQAQVRSSLVGLIQNGVKLGALHPMIEAFESLDRTVQQMTEPSEICQSQTLHPDFYTATNKPSPDEFYHWRDRAMKAEAELKRLPYTNDIGQTPDPNADR